MFVLKRDIESWQSKHLETIMTITEHLSSNRQVLTLSRKRRQNVPQYADACNDYIHNTQLCAALFCVPVINSAFVGI